MPTIFYHGVFADLWTGLLFREGGRFRPFTWSDGGDLCNKDIRAKIELFSTEIHKHYDALEVTIMNRTDGTIDMSVLKFGDIIGLKNGTNPYFWDERNSTGWYGFKMTGDEYDQISDTVHDYMAMFAEENIGYEMRTL